MSTHVPEHLPVQAGGSLESDRAAPTTRCISSRSGKKPLYMHELNSGLEEENTYQ